MIKKSMPHFLAASRIGVDDMPTRKITTRLEITGESEYKSALSRINTELKNLQSALKLTDSEFQAQTNSMEALQKKSDALTAVYEVQRRKKDKRQAGDAPGKQNQSDYCNS